MGGRVVFVVVRTLRAIAIMSFILGSIVVTTPSASAGAEGVECSSYIVAYC
jgi:hypothetical protein